MSIEFRTIVKWIGWGLLLVILAIAGFLYQSAETERRALNALSRRGGTFTYQSARMASLGRIPFSEVATRLYNPVTEVDLSTSSWPRAKSVYALVTDDDLVDLAPLTKLQRLSLRGMPITDEGIKHLQRFRQLKYLDLREAKVTQAAAAALQRELPGCHLDL